MQSYMKHFLLITAALLYSLGPLHAESVAEYRTQAATVLSHQFDTVAYASTGVLSRFGGPVTKDTNGASDPSVPISLRLPFVQLIGGLRTISPIAVTDLFDNYSGVLVGAKGFAPPEGLGMVSAQQCYVGILRPGGRAVIANDLNSVATTESVDGSSVRTWSAPPYEGHPRPTKFFLAEVSGVYVVMANDLDEFRSTMQHLQTDSARKAFRSSRWISADGDYWVHRFTAVADPGESEQRATKALALTFKADTVALKGQLIISGANEDSKTTSDELPASDVFHYEPAGSGVWQAAVPLSQDPAATTALYKVMYLFGFGVSL